MARPRETKGAVETLDELVSEFTLRAVLRMLTEVCYRRANKATTDEQRFHWNKASQIVEHAATEAFRLGA